MPNIDVLFQPTSIGRMALPNRLVMPPMVTNYATEDGRATKRLIDYLVRRARGGVGLIIVEASYVRPDGRGFVNQLGIHRDDLVPGLRDLVTAVHDAGSKVAIQLYHAGRQTTSAITGTQPIAPSPIPDPATKQMPRELSLAEIEQVEGDFAAAARRAVEAGFDAVEIHGAHGYLIGQFMSPFSNRRVDAYGGGTRTRTRFAIEVVHRVRSVVGPDYPVLFRMSAEERVEGGLTLDQTRIMASLLEEAGVDAFHVSVGNYATPGGLITAPMDVERGLLVPLAAEIKRVVSVPVIAVDRLHDPLLAAQVVATGQADLVAVGRGLLADPDLPSKAQRGALDEILPCIACNQGCIGPLLRQQPIGCLVNPTCGREVEFTLVKTARPKRVVVVGGGPAGLAAARVLAERGHKVVLLEERRQLGGEFLAAAIPPRKEEIAEALTWMIRRVCDLGVDVRLNTRATPDDVQRLAPEAVIVATGGRPVQPSIHGLDRTDTLLARDVLLGLRPVGADVLVVGAGPSGLAVAEYLAVQMKRVTVVEAAATLGVGVEPSRLYWILDALQRAGVTLRPGVSVRAIEPGGAVRGQTARGDEDLGSFDSIVLATGYRANDALYQVLSVRVPSTYLVGDALQVRSALEAILEGATTARAI